MICRYGGRLGARLWRVTPLGHHTHISTMAATALCFINSKHLVSRFCSSTAMVSVFFMAVELQNRETRCLLFIKKRHGHCSHCGNIGTRRESVEGIYIITLRLERSVTVECLHGRIGYLPRYDFSRR